MMETGLRQERRDGVLWLTLDRPRAANALNGELQRALIAALAQAATDAATRAVVLASTSARIFSAGADLKEDWHADPATARRMRADMLLETLFAFAGFPKPLIAAVTGKAIGAGVMLAFLADEIICAPDAEFSLPEIHHDMPTPLGATIIAARAPHAMVHKLVQVGEVMDAVAVLRASLIAEILPADLLQQGAQARAARLGALPARAYAGNKVWINATLRNALRAAAAHGADLRTAPFAGGGDSAA